jgi:hypothetical protein
MDGLADGDQQALCVYCHCPLRGWLQEETVGASLRNSNDLIQSHDIMFFRWQ